MDLTSLVDFRFDADSFAPSGSAVKQVKILKLARKLAALRAEGLAIYRPLPVGDLFHACTKKFRAVIGSNRAGKTLCAGAEATRIFTGVDPHDKAPKADGRAWVIGLDGDHLALMYNIIAEQGAFQRIRDEHTGMWRAVRPHPNDPTRLDDYDEAYREKWKDAPPLLPPRLVRQVAWEDKRKGVPRIVSLTNGWETLWRSSRGKSPQGDHLNFVWIDEQIENEDFYKEGVRGLVGLQETRKHMPRLVWSATPQNFNIQLLELRDRAEDGSPDTASFSLVIEDNPYVTDEERRAFFDGLDDDEREVRYHGVPAMERSKVYPTYDPQGIHGYDSFPIDPGKWSRYVGLDPGRQHCGSLFMAIDPEEAHGWVYDSFDLRNSDAATWAREVKKRENGCKFEAFVIDQQMGKQTAPGQAKCTAQIYFEALKAAGVTPRRLGPMHGFFPGTNDISAREESLGAWLNVRPSGPHVGTPFLQVARGMNPALDKQFRRAVYKRGRRDKNVPGDVLVCAEYLAGFRPTFKQPEVTETVRRSGGASVRQQFEDRKERMRARKQLKRRSLR